MFRWAGEAFGSKIGFVAMFLVFLQVCVFFPTALTFGAVSLAFIGPDQTWDQALSGNKAFVLSVVLSIYWLATIISLFGVGAFSKMSKYGGIIGTIIPAIILIILGFIFLFKSPHIQIALDWSHVIPDFTKFDNIVLAASIFLFYAGIEMNAFHVKELNNATKSYPMAIGIASITIVSIFVFGTLAIAFVIPQADINLTQSLLVTYYDIFKWAGIGFLAPVMAICLAIGVLAGIVTWVAGPSSGLLTVAKAGYLPRFLQVTNKHGMPIHILMLQGFIVTFLSVIFIVLPSVQSAYQILQQLAAIIYLTLYMFMFSSVLHLRFSQPNRPRPYRIPGGTFGLWLFTILGFVSVFAAFVFSFIPPSQINIGSNTTYVLILIASSLFILIIPFIIFHFRRDHWRDEESTFAPFTWQVEGIHPGLQNTSTIHTPGVTAKHFENKQNTQNTNNGEPKAEETTTGTSP